VIDLPVHLLFEQWFPRIRTESLPIPLTRVRKKVGEKIALWLKRKLLVVPM